MQTSCVIPTRNRCQMVQEAITSVLQQCIPIQEIIVVDDGSTDNTSSIITSCFPMVKIIRLSGLGAGPARNAGVEAASNDIIMFLDSDDLWLPGHAESLLKVLAGGHNVAYGITETIDLTDNSVFRIPAKEEQQLGDCFHALLRWCFLVPSAVAVTREAFIRTGGFNNEKFEDWSFFLRLADKYPFGFTDHVITSRRLHGGSLSALAARDKIVSGLKEISHLLPQLESISSLDIKRFHMTTNWVHQQSTEWHTLQDWYLAMKKEGFI